LKCQKYLEEQYSAEMRDYVHEMKLRLDVPVDDCMVARADRNRLDQLLFNLITNARDAMPEGGTITVRAGRRELDGSTAPMIWIEVEDHGAGIAPGDRDAIFDPFFSTKPGSAGLGLTAVANIIEAQGWELSLESVPGHGSKFRVELTGIAADAEVSDPEVAAASGGRILLVDDNATLARITARTLERDGFEAIALASAEAGLERLRSERFDALVTDVNMPGMDGVELAEHALSLQPEINVVLITGQAEPRVDDPRLRVLRKPYADDELRRALSRPQPGALP
jgi:two-component system cell cycle sensor histidine kinase/response regulator CckA